jgi:hypothetical protein
MQGMGAHLSKPRSFKSGGRKYGLFRKPVTDRGRISGWAYMESLKMGNPAQECFDYAGGYNSPNFVLRSRVVSCAYTRLWSFDLARCHHKIPRITKTPGGGLSSAICHIHFIYIIVICIRHLYTLEGGHGTFGDFGYSKPDERLFCTPFGVRFGSISRARCPKQSDYVYWPFTHRPSKSAICKKHLYNIIRPFPRNRNHCW